MQDAEFRKLQRRIEGVEDMTAQHPLHASPTLAEWLDLLKRKQAVHGAVKATKKEIKAAQSLILQEDLKHRRKVLKRLGYVDKEGIVSLKGRVASEIRTGNELVLTELMFDGVFNDLTIEQICALMSCFIWRDKSEVGGVWRRDQALYLSMTT